MMNTTFFSTIINGIKAEYYKVKRHKIDAYCFGGACFCHY
jgi:hypothetical protein